jgi:hypothetical protein
LCFRNFVPLCKAGILKHMADQNDSEPVEVKGPTSVAENAAETGQPGDSVVEEKEKEIVRRPFRVKLRGSVLVLMRLPNKRDVQGKFHQLSITGGMIHVEKPLDEKLEVELIFHIREATIRSKAQMLFPMWATQGWMQPFRFKDLSEESRETLDKVLKSFVGQAAATGAAAGV